MSDKHRIPRDIDAPTPLFFWTAVEVVIATMFVGVGLVMGSFGFGIILGASVLALSKNLRDENAKRGQAQHLLWRFGIEIDGAMKRFPSSLQMEFTE